MKRIQMVVAVAAFCLGGSISNDLSAQGSSECKIATGEFDREAGASNNITTCEVLDAIGLVKKGRVVPLGRIYEAGMPLFGQRVYQFNQQMPPEVPPGEEFDPRPTGGVIGDNNVIFNEGLMVASEIDQVGTQFDGLGHAGRAHGDDPRKGSYYLNLPVKQVNRTPAEPEGGLKRLGVEHVKPFVTRGILIDLAPLGGSTCAGEPCWDSGQEILLDDVTDALDRQGLSEADITKGDAVFFNTGWGNLWMVDNNRFNAGEPGIGDEVAQWLADKGVVLVGADTWAVEVIPRSDTQVFAVHQFLIRDKGIFLFENLVFDELIAEGIYVFMYMFTPVPIKGATGSPGSPIALY